MLGRILGSQKDKEMNLYSSNSFPFFYVSKVSKGNLELINLNEDINVYIPKKIDACWATKTPCVGGANHLDAKKILGFNIFLNKHK